MYYIAISFHMQQDIYSFFSHFTQKPTIAQKIPTIHQFRNSDIKNRIGRLPFNGKNSYLTTNVHSAVRSLRP